MKVIVLEDDDTIRLLIAMQLQQAGFNVFAPPVWEADKVFDHELWGDADAAVMDWSLDWIKPLRILEWGTAMYPSVEVAIFSGFTKKEIDAAALELAHYIPKGDGVGAVQAWLDGLRVKIDGPV